MKTQAFRYMNGINANKMYFWCKNFKIDLR